jgi:hypothetical protein
MTLHSLQKGYLLPPSSSSEQKMEAVDYNKTYRFINIFVHGVMSYIKIILTVNR